MKKILRINLVLDDQIKLMETEEKILIYHIQNSIPLFPDHNWRQ